MGGAENHLSILALSQKRGFRWKRAAFVHQQGVRKVPKRFGYDCGASECALVQGTEEMEAFARRFRERDSQCKRAELSARATENLCINPPLMQEF